MTTIAEMIQEEEAERLKYEAETIVTAEGLSIADLRQRFERVQNKGNWKLPVEYSFEQIPPIDEVRAYEDAIRFFTGSHDIHWAGEFVFGGVVTLHAEGYYAASGA